MQPARRLPSLNALRALEAVQETGSVSGAARRLHVSHSAVSHQIRQLEDWIGRPVTVRRGRSVTLTEAGESLARVVHDSFDAIRHEIDLLPLRFKRAVSISALPVIAEKILLENLDAFGAMHPDISLHLSLAQTDRPKSPAPDVEILFRRHERLLPDEAVLFPGDAVPVCAPRYLHAAGGQPMAVVQNGPLLSDEDSRMWARWLQQAGPDWQPDPGVRTIYFEGSFLLQKAAELGVGVALCRKATLAPALRSGTLVMLSDTAIDQDWAYTMRIAAGREVEPEVRIVKAWLNGLTDPAKA